MKNIAFFLVVLFSGFSASANAAVAVLENVSIKSYTVYRESGYFVLAVTLNENISGTGCATSDSTDTFGYWVSGNTNDVMNIWLSFLMGADAMGRKIDLSYDSASGYCWALVGAQIFGLKMHPLP